MQNSYVIKATEWIIISLISKLILNRRKGASKRFLPTEIKLFRNYWQILQKDQTGEEKKETINIGDIYQIESHPCKSPHSKGLIEINLCTFGKLLRHCERRKDKFSGVIRGVCDTKSLEQFAADFIIVRAACEFPPKRCWHCKLFHFFLRNRCGGIRRLYEFQITATDCCLNGHPFATK